MYSRVACISFVTAAFLAAIVNGSGGLCTGYPKTYNGKPCASTTRYWDGQKGACGCGSSDSNPFSWQWQKPTAAASAPIFGSGTWCGSGCGKCFKLTPTGIGASVAGKGATNTASLIVKVSNLCPYGGNEEWCAVDVNAHDYDAHFDLMDYNMNGLITAQGWDNPEVTYEEVSCSANGYTDWNCQCASASSPSTGGGSSTSGGSNTAPTSAPSKAATTAPTRATSKATTPAQKPAVTSNPVTPTNAPASSGTDTAISAQVSGGVNAWWFGFNVGGADYAKVEIMDNGKAFKTWTAMNYQGDKLHWGMYQINPSQEMQLPLSLKFTTNAGNTVIASKIITSWTANQINL